MALPNEPEIAVTIARLLRRQRLLEALVGAMAVLVIVMGCMGGELFIEAPIRKR